jgi:hypothetical protein
VTPSRKTHQNTDRIVSTTYNVALFRAFLRSNPPRFIGYREETATQPV